MIYRKIKYILFLIALLFNKSMAQNTLDQFQYHYNTTNNQLQYVSDAVNATNSTVDIDDQTNNNFTTENYAYNANGQLTKDEQANIQSISWCINGKVKEVVKSTGEKIKFYYDAMGNKVKKVKTNADQTTLTTYYTYKPMGGVVAVYEDNGATINKVEAKLDNGTDQASIDITTSVSTTKLTREITTKNYELKDHLGNVRATVSDVKELNTDLTTFSAQLTTANDYYAFGMLMPGRDYQGSNYRYGFGGKEKENDLNGNANAYDFGARILDPRLGRWLSVDPLADMYPSLNPYCAMGNNPLFFTDPDGRILQLADTNSSGEALTAQDRQNYSESTDNMRRDSRSRRVIEQLEKSKKVYTVIISDNPEDGSFNPETGVILWNPSRAVIGEQSKSHSTLKRALSSPQNVLLHEFIHANHFDLDPEKYIRDCNTPLNGEFDNMEEYNTITELFEMTGVRHINHRGDFYPVNGVNSVVPNYARITQQQLYLMNEIVRITQELNNTGTLTQEEREKLENERSKKLIKLDKLTELIEAANKE